MKVVILILWTTLGGMTTTVFQDRKACEVARDVAHAADKSVRGVCVAQGSQQ